MAQEETWYTVELIVFERTDQAALGEEFWPMEPGLPALFEALELLPSQAQAPASGDTGLARAFRRLGAEEYGLTDALERLAKSESYRPLLHLAWNQPGFPREQAKTVHVHDGNSTFGGTSGAGARSGDTFTGGYLGTPFSARASMARDPSRSALDGTVRLHRARYLHAQVDLLYYRPPLGPAPATTSGAQGDPAATTGGAAVPALPDSSDAGLAEQLLAEELREPTLFRLTQSRRMRSGEIHYLDHPLFGVLIQIRPLDNPPQRAAPAETPAEMPTTPAGDAPAGTQPAPAATGTSG